MEGFINLLKPAGMTSHDGVYALRRMTGIKKIGHTGTLDPMAAGVLPLCVGNGTRIIPYLEGDDKAYRCEMLLGVETDTQDIWGTVTEDRRGEEIMPVASRVEQCFAGYIGEIVQVPPSFSAVKVKGKPLYAYARKGQKVAVSPRKTVIHSLAILSYDPSSGRILFDVSCSKGTYVRTLCQDLGRELGTGGTMSFLVRIRSGSFTLADAVTLEELEQGVSRFLLPLDHPLSWMGLLEIPESRRKWFRNGGSLRQGDVTAAEAPSRGGKGLYRVYCGGDFMGVAVLDGDKGLYLADKVFDR